MEPESSPLLQGSPQSTTPVDSAGDAHAGRRHRTRFYMWIYLLVFLDCFSGFLLDVPLIQLLERTVCWREAGPDSLLLMDNSPPFCKSPAVQREVAIINGFKGSFDSLAGNLTRPLNEADQLQSDLCARSSHGLDLRLSRGQEGPKAHCHSFLCRSISAPFVDPVCLYYSCCLSRPRGSANLEWPRLQ